VGTSWYYHAELRNVVVEVVEVNMDSLNLFIKLLLIRLQPLLKCIFRQFFRVTPR